MKNILFLISLFFVYSCDSSDSNDLVQTDHTDGAISEYMLTNISGSKVQIAEKVDVNGNILETGQLLNGKKTGTWIEYYPDKDFPKKVSTYVAGKLNGMQMEMSTRGQISTITNYQDNQLNGSYGTYKFGRPEVQATYKNGKLDGVYKSYFNNSDKIQKEVHYKNGIQDGAFKQFNETGELVLEYEYENGKVKSGGMTKEAAN